MGKRYTLRLSYDAEILLDENDLNSVVDEESYAKDLFLEMVKEDNMWLNIDVINVEDVDDDIVWYETDMYEERII